MGTAAVSPRRTGLRKLLAEDELPAALPRDCWGLRAERDFSPLDFGSYFDFYNLDDKRRPLRPHRRHHFSDFDVCYAMCYVQTSSGTRRMPRNSHVRTMWCMVMRAA